MLKNQGLELQCLLKIKENLSKVLKFSTRYIKC